LEDAESEELGKIMVLYFDRRSSGSSIKAIGIVGWVFERVVPLQVSENL
jgi:hypothetical protein